jgi:5-methylcytosine-specific restriction endonuclease McrA
MSVLQERVLVLNRSWQPIQVTTVRSAVTRVYQGSARFVDPETYATHAFESWKDAAQFSQDAVRFLRGAGWTMAVPEVIVLRHYNGFRRQRVRFTRRNVYARDDDTCQYCGRVFSTKDLSLDHVIPRSRGGRSTWENLVVACHRCNRRKDNRTPEEAGMRLIRRPERPRATAAPLRAAPGEVPASWEAFLSDLYWNLELKK